MENDTIFALFERSIAKGPIGSGSMGCVYRLDDPELSHYLLKVRHEYLETPTKLKAGLIHANTKLFALDTGFAGSNVGQILLCDENRRIFCLLKQEGESLEQRLARYRTETGDDIQAGARLIKDLLVIPDSGLRGFFADIMKATNQRVGIDLFGENNIFISGKGLHLLDIPVLLDQYYDPTFYNHVEGIDRYLENVFEPLREKLLPEQYERLRTEMSCFEEKLKALAETMGFPKNLEEVETHLHRKKVLFQGVRGIEHPNLTFSDSRAALNAVLLAVSTPSRSI